MNCRSPTINDPSGAERAVIYDELNSIIATLHELDFEGLGLAKHGRRGNYARRQLKTWGRQFRLARPAINCRPPTIIFLGCLS